jgi:SRSO17 transposase
MTARRPCPPAPGPLESYAARFDAFFHSLAQRRGFREYLVGLLLPHDRNKTLTALAGAEPVVQAQAAAVQRLQFFLSEAAWEADAINAQRLALLCEQAATAPHPNGVLVLDDTGDRKDGTATAHVARQYLGSVGKIDQGIVAVTTLWADDRCYWPVHVEPYTPAARLPEGKHDPAFRTKPQMALTLIERAQALGLPFRAVVADCFYGDHDGLVAAFFAQGIPYVLARRGRVGLGWAPVEAAHSFEDAALELPRHAWQAVIRRFRDGHTESWWAAELTLFGYGPQQLKRAIVATTDPHTLPPLTTWYLSTNLPETDAPLADLIELYGLRNWVEESYKRQKDELGWADFMVRSDRAIRRHWALVYCAFSFCWWHEVQAWVAGIPVAPPPAPTDSRPVQFATDKTREKNAHSASADGTLAQSPAAGAGLAGALAMAFPLLAGVEPPSPAARIRSAAGRCHRGTRDIPLSPGLTNYR